MWNEHGIRNLFISLIIISTLMSIINIIVTLVAEYMYFATNIKSIHYLETILTFRRQA